MRWDQRLDRFLAGEVKLGGRQAHRRRRDEGPDRGDRARRRGPGHHGRVVTLARGTRRYGVMIATAAGLGSKVPDAQ